MFAFKLVKKLKSSNVRVGKITTSHGVIHTPAFVPVGTKATVKSLSSEDIASTKTQIFFVNTYHMMVNDTYKTVEKAGGLHAFMHWENPIITDSGGFQVFSLNRDEAPQKVTITDKKISFRSHTNGDLIELTPLKSLQIQSFLGADIILPLDDCSPYPATRQKAVNSLERTQAWAKDSLGFYDANRLESNNQSLYGITQGSVYEDLRKQSAQYIGSLPFQGFAIGGVSVGENKRLMTNICKWSIPYLPEEKPRHLLGVGELDDIFRLVEEGIDTFDCVLPTRIARMGHVLVQGKQKKTKSLRKKIQKQFEIDIVKAEYTYDFTPIDPECICWVCKNYSRAYLHHLFKQKELLAYRLATYHNIYFMNHLFALIRESIMHNTFSALQSKWLR